MNGSPGHAAARIRTAWHEAGHAVAAWVLERPISVVSIRPGLAYRGVTMFDRDTATGDMAARFDASLPALLQPIETRVAIERGIVVSLAGPEAADLAGLPDGYDDDDACDLEAQRAAEGLDALPIPLRDQVVERETDPTAMPTDETVASELSWALLGEPLQSVLHVAWLREVTHDLLVSRRSAVRTIAEALLERTVISGADVIELLAPRKEPSMPRLSSTPAPNITSDGYHVILPEPLTLDHPHARVAVEGFWSSVAMAPNGRVIARRTWVATGQLVDDRSALVQRHRDRFRKPTTADREASA